jgi:hypothetical protein
MRWWRIISRFGDVFEPIPGETGTAALAELHREAEIAVEYDPATDELRFPDPVDAHLHGKLAPWRFEELGVTVFSSFRRGRS